MQAYYLARSGAEAIASEIINEKADSEIIKYFDGGNTELVTQDISLGVGEGTFKATITRHGDNDEQIKIVSTGTVEEVTESITLYMNAGDTGDPDLFGSAIFSVSDFTFGNSSEVIGGGVESKGQIINAPAGLPVSSNSQKNYNTANFPDQGELDDATIAGDGTPLNPNLNDNNDAVIKKEDYPNGVYLGHIDKNNGDMHFEIPNNETFVVWVDSIKLNNNSIYVWHEYDPIPAVRESHGEGGTLLLFIYDKPVHNNPAQQINELKSEQASNLIIFLNKGISLNVQTGNTKFSGYIYGPGADVSIQGQGTVYGAIIAKAMDRGNINPFNGTVDYVEPPPTLVDLISDYITDLPTTPVYEKYLWSK